MRGNVDAISTSLQNIYTYPLFHHSIHLLLFQIIVACFEAPKERKRIKTLLSTQEHLYPNLFNHLISTMKPLLSGEFTPSPASSQPKGKKKTNNTNNKKNIQDNNSSDATNINNNNNNNNNNTVPTPNRSIQGGEHEG